MVITISSELVLNFRVEEVSPLYPEDGGNSVF
jgi:hypothetical protein